MTLITSNVEADDVPVFLSCLDWIHESLRYRQAYPEETPGAENSAHPGAASSLAPQCALAHWPLLSERNELIYARVGWSSTCSGANLHCLNSATFTVQHLELAPTFPAPFKTTSTAGPVTVTPCTVPRLPLSCLVCHLPSPCSGQPYTADCHLTL